MASVDEVLDAMSDENTIDAIDFVIDENLRTIAIPSDGVVIGVVGDKNVNIVNFKMVRFYDGWDMSNFVARINYVNALGETSYKYATQEAVTDDYIRFSWLVDSDVTAYMGSVKFIVRLTKTTVNEDESTFIQRFNTTISQVNVLEGLDVDLIISEEEKIDILTRMQLDMDAYTNLKKKELSEYVDRLTGSDISSGETFGGASVGYTYAKSGLVIAASAMSESITGEVSVEKNRKHLYNGLALPVIEEISDYPYIMIRKNDDTGYYDCVYSNSPLIWSSETFLLSVKNAKWKHYRIKQDVDPLYFGSWVSYESGTYSGTSGWTMSSTKTVQWTNADILDSNGEIKIPVGTLVIED